MVIRSVAVLGQLLNESFIRHRSNELQVPFENFLAASILEEIVQRIAESKYAENFWIKNSTNLSMEHWKKKVNRKLFFMIKDTEKLHYKKAEISNVFAELFRNIKKDAIHWNYCIQVDWNIFYANLTAAIASVKVPVQIKLEHITDKDLTPYSREIQLITNNHKKLKLYCYPSEYIISEKFLSILEKLELVNDMSDYMDLYEIIKKESLSGRKISEILQENCCQHGIVLEEERFNLLLSYRTSKYMEKKWKAYLRHEKKKSPSWEEVIVLLDKFFSNIWMSLCSNVIYLGDWIPELKRFID